MFSMSHLSFFIVALASLAAAAPAAVTITADDYEGRAQFKVETARATYSYDRAGGGFSRMLDRDGRDWITFRKEPLKGGLAAAAAGYRGIPNLVHGAKNPDAGAGHPGFDLCTSVIAGPDTIRTVTRSGRWAWSWRFTDEHATLTVEQADRDHAWWFLYEGTIGGRWSPPTHSWGTDAGGPRRDKPDNSNPIFERWRWVYFGDDAAPRVLLMAQHVADDAPDTMWYMGSTAQRLHAPDGMVVFGFGRASGTRPQFRGAGHKFTIGFIEEPVKDAAAHARIAAVADKWIQVTAARAAILP